MKALLEFIPIILFLVLIKKQDVWVATQALMISTAIVHFIFFIIQKYKLTKLQWFVLFATLAFGSITLLLHDDFWIRLKSPIIYAVTAVVFLLSPLFLKNNEPLVKKAFESAFELSSKAWIKLNVAWVVFFLFLAGLNAYFAVYLHAEYWADIKFYSIILSTVFIVANFILLRKHFKHPEA